MMLKNAASKIGFFIASATRYTTRPVAIFPDYEIRQMRSELETSAYHFLTQKKIQEVRNLNGYDKERLKKIG